jgi:hypothetical protein
VESPSASEDPECSPSGFESGGGQNWLISTSNPPPCVEGPALVSLYCDPFAEVVADVRDRREAKPGTTDVLIANWVAPANLCKSAAEMDDPAWHKMFDMGVHRTRCLYRSILPTIYARHAVKVVGIGSVTGLKALEGVSAYLICPVAGLGCEHCFWLFKSFSYPGWPR